MFNPDAANSAQGASPLKPAHPVKTGAAKTAALPRGPASRPAPLPAMETALIGAGPRTPAQARMLIEAAIERKSHFEALQKMGATYRMTIPAPQSDPEGRSAAITDIVNPDDPVQKQAADLVHHQNALTEDDHKGALALADQHLPFVELTVARQD